MPPADAGVGEAIDEAASFGAEVADAVAAGEGGEMQEDAGGALLQRGMSCNYRGRRGRCGRVCHAVNLLWKGGSCAVSAVRLSGCSAAEGNAGAAGNHWWNGATNREPCV